MLDTFNSFSMSSLSFSKLTCFFQKEKVCVAIQAYLLRSVSMNFFAHFTTTRIEMQRNRKIFGLFSSSLTTRLFSSSFRWRNSRFVQNMKGQGDTGIARDFLQKERVSRTELKEFSSTSLESPTSFLNSVHTPYRSASPSSSSSLLSSRSSSSLISSSPSLRLRDSSDLFLHTTRSSSFSFSASSSHPEFRPFLLQHAFSSLASDVRRSRSNAKDLSHVERELRCTYTSKRHFSITYPSCRKLSDVVKLPLLRLKPPTEIASMWNDHFHQNALASTASIRGSMFESLSANSQAAPHFILPLPRLSSSPTERDALTDTGGGSPSFEMFYTQFLSPKICLVTSLQEFQARQNRNAFSQSSVPEGKASRRDTQEASPFLVVTFYDELMKEKDLVLIKGDILRGGYLSKDEATHLISLLLMFYGGDLNLNRWVLEFNMKPREFSFDEFQQTFPSFFYTPLQKSITILDK
ncbi:atp synthase mitochondrial f1 complex assembly factor 1 [Cystoisospora suis]|uniref:Atp synthase mitochondrial f1 complex assembly factor 1 n=1 Tax=Cystoisospora suis TaxID=483139 RepID=A0A2C6KQ85_9APIC|nr:atp synthase mitochondrial f1 complex assembly factor 1 [Cystoisospora suis]